MSDFNDRYDPNSMDNYMDDLYFDEHYGSSGGSGFSGGSVLLLLLAIPVFIVGMILLVAVPPLGALVMLGGYKILEG